MARRNGKYSCLDCQDQCTEECSSCNNCDQFKLDVDGQNLTYAEKNEKHERKSQEWIAQKLRETLEPD